MRTKGISNNGLRRISQAVSTGSFDAKEDAANFMSSMAEKVSAIGSAIDQVFYNLDERHSLKDSDPSAQEEAQALLALIKDIMQTQARIWESSDLVRADAEAAWDSVDGV